MEWAKKGTTREFDIFRSLPTPGKEALSGVTKERKRERERERDKNLAPLLCTYIYIYI